MIEKLNEQLQEGEQLLWSGKPAFKALGKTLKGYYLAKTVVVLAALIGFFAYYAKIIAAGQTGFKVSVLVVMGALGGVALAMEWLDVGKMKKTVYGITDRRLIAVVENSVHSVAYDKIKEYKFDTDKDGQVSLLIGKSAMSARAKNHRTNAIFGTRMTDDGSACDRFVFYAIPEADKVEKLMKKYVK